METASPEPQTQVQQTASPWMAYVVPMALFMVLTVLEGYLPKALYPWVYIGKVGIVTASLVVFRSVWKEIRVEGRVLVPAFLVGLAVFVEWVWLEKWIHYPHLGTRSAFNPFVAIPVPTTRMLFLAFRFFGLAVMVPIMEEIFWRSFLLRFITTEKFTSLPVGTFSWAAFAAVAGGFGLAHPEWLVAVLCAVAYGLLLKQTKSLFACIVAHAVTNLTLGIYVLTAHDWKFW